jgi:NAD-dependent DNA ligase
VSLSTAKDLTNYTSDELIEFLQRADDAYHNTSNVIVDDTQYDAIYQYTKRLTPHHQYFVGVGSMVRGGKVELPYQMGSLDQVYYGEMAGWIAKHNLHSEYVTITDKLDGTSAMLVYGANGDLQIAYSRGDGVRGADITRHISNLPSVPKNVGGAKVVRGEVIIAQSKFDQFKSCTKRSDGSDYKNARNATAGMMNASDQHSTDTYKCIEFIAYQDVTARVGKDEMLADLTACGFNTPFSIDVLGSNLSDHSLIALLKDRKAKCDYDLDGLVIDVRSNAKRAQMNPTKDTLNPAWAIKYKAQDDDNVALATVVEVEWNVSKHGYLKPRVRIEPTELVGVTIKHATGFNAKFIFENMIGPGAVVRITRSGDVIPYIQEVVKPMPLENMQ